MNLKYLFKFCIYLMLMSVVIYAVHRLILIDSGHSFDTKKMTVSYLLSFMLCSASFFILYHGTSKFASSLGFAFMWTSFVKFGAYLLVFKLIFVLDSVPKGIDVSMLLVPYLSTLFFEVYYITRLIKD